MEGPYPMSQLASTQSQSRPQIFVAQDGSPLLIFVESNGVADNRPKLIRNLRNHGASICSDVSLARIILVEPHSSEGRQFVREWGMDPDKIILEVAWAHRCIEAGRALLEHDAWGGCGNLDGTPLEDDTDDDNDPGLFPERDAKSTSRKQSGSSTNVPPRAPSAANANKNNWRKSSLPTPRPTPVEQSTSHSNVFGTSHNGISPSHRLPTPPSSSTSGQASIMQPQFQQNFQPSMPQGTPMPSPFGQLVPQGHFQMPMNPQMVQNFLMNNPEAATIAMQMMMAANGMGMSQGQWQGQPQQNLMPWIQPQPIQPQNSMPLNNNGSFVDPSPPIESGYRSSPQPMVSDKDSRSASPLPTFTAISDESGSDSPPPTQSILTQRGKKRSRSSQGPSSSRTAKRSKSPPIPHSKKREKKRSSLSNEYTPKHKEPVKVERPIPKGIFTARGGEPMTFFLQVQLRNRVELVAQLRKNGGKMVSDLQEATFIILDTRPGKERDQWMKVVNDLGRFALRTGFIEACINSDGIVEEDDFKIKTAKKPQKSTVRKKKVRQESVESEQGDYVDYSPPSKKKQPVNSVAQPSIVIGNGSRSPSPPTGPPKEVSPGRFAFTEEELEYAYKLARHLFRRNPDMNYYTLSVEVVKRTNTHSQASWLYTLNRKHEEVQRAREEAMRSNSSGLVPDLGPTASALASAPITATAGSEHEEDQVEGVLGHPMNVDDSTQNQNSTGSVSQNGHSNNVPEKQSTEKNPELHDADIRTIVHFFAYAPEGMTDDETLWATITAAHTCKTCPSWPEFYQRNQEEVNELLTKELDEKERAIKAA